MLAEIIGKEAKLKYEKPKLGDVKSTHAKISKAEKLLKYKPKISIREGLSKFVEWHRIYGKDYYTRYG